MTPPQYLCQTCGEGQLCEIQGFSQLPRVTSDSRQFRPGGKLFVCERCGLAQKIVDEIWLGEAAEIYRNYDIYHQSTANDQPVFDPGDGKPSGRCEVIARQLQVSGILPASGSLLDVGTGGGAILSAFSTACPGWRLFGLDLDDRKLRALQEIPRFERLFTGAPELLQERFDLVTLIHSLEHFADPLPMLRRLRDRLYSGGHLFVQVNNVERTPFDFVVADHLCHFDQSSLAQMAACAGFSIEILRSDWVPKELSLVAVPGSQAPQPAIDDPSHSIAKVQSAVAWLTRTLDHARDVSWGKRFGIFGTSVAATWLASGLEGSVDFFVDEDPARLGRTHLGQRILTPAQVPSGSVVYLAFASEVASGIQKRLAHLPVVFTFPVKA